jgi:hypothetical protein
VVDVTFIEYRVIRTLWDLTLRIEELEAERRSDGG